MKTLELSRVPHWLARAESWQEEQRARVRRWVELGLTAFSLGLLCGALVALLEWGFSR